MSERTIKVTDNAFGIAAMLRPPVREMFIGRSAEQLDIAANEVIKLYATLDKAPWETLAAHLNAIASMRRASVMTEQLIKESEASAADGDESAKIGGKAEKNVIEIVGRREFDEIEARLMSQGYRVRYNCYAAAVTEFRNKQTGDVKMVMTDHWLK